MKKQILILTFFVAAILAGTTSAFGQVLDSSIVSTYPLDTLTCEATSLPLHPMPGVEYTYKMDGTVGADTVQLWTWFATKDSTFISNIGIDTTDMLYQAPGDLLSVGSNYGVIGGTSDNVQITWSPSILQRTDYNGAWDLDGDPTPSPTFVVGYGTGECADNIEVYSIDPQPAFVIDIANITEAGVESDWGVADSSCVSLIESATYNQGANQLDVDYGSDTIYFEIAAKNFVNGFTPVFTLMSGLNANGGTSETAEVALFDTWSEAQSGLTPLGEDLTFANGDSTSFGGVVLTAADDDALTTGASAWVRLVVHHNQYETVVRSPILVAIDGVDASDQWDLEDGDCDDADNVGYNTLDQVTHIITPRPEINAIPTTSDDPTTEDDLNNVPDDAIDKQQEGSTY